MAVMTIFWVTFKWSSFMMSSSIVSCEWHKHLSYAEWRYEKWGLFLPYTLTISFSRFCILWEGECTPMNRYNVGTFSLVNRNMFQDGDAAQDWVECRHRDCISFPIRYVEVATPFAMHTFIRLGAKIDGIFYQHIKYKTWSLILDIPWCATFILSWTNLP